MDETFTALEAQVAQAPAALSKVFVVCNQHTSLASGDMLVGIKAEDADLAEASAGTAVVRLTVHLGRILDDFELVLFSQVKNGLHVDRQSVNMHDHYRPCSGRDRGLDSLGGHVPVARIAIDQNGGGAGTDNRRGA